MNDLQAYAEACGKSPSTVIQAARCGGGATWRKWQNGASCSLHTAERLQDYMADNPPPDSCSATAEKGAA